MKLTLLAITTALFLAATPSMAAEAAVTTDTQLNTHVADDAEKLEAFLSERSELADSGDWQHAYWHCTAFPNNDPHHTDAPMVTGTLTGRPITRRCRRANTTITTVMRTATSITAKIRSDS